mmetsp:Transcript_77989/g.130989  ORF Transcript_77989/g.130989 Transcript_77989/m.130989 type:complete len:243 (-) Transcript_77989:395-1123(-)
MLRIMSNRPHHTDFHDQLKIYDADNPVWQWLPPCVTRDLFWAHQESTSRVSSDGNPASPAMYDSPEEPCHNNTETGPPSQGSPNRRFCQSRSIRGAAGRRGASLPLAGGRSTAGGRRVLLFAVRVKILWNEIPIDAVLHRIRCGSRCCLFLLLAGTRGVRFLSGLVHLAVNIERSGASQAKDDCPCEQKLGVQGRLGIRDNDGSVVHGGQVSLVVVIAVIQFNHQPILGGSNAGVSHEAVEQ